VILIHFCDVNSLMMQEVFEAERRCNAIEDETRRIQLTAAELLRACHDEKACAAFELCFCCSTDPVLQIAVSNKLVGLEQAVSEYAHNITSAIAAK